MTKVHVVTVLGGVGFLACTGLRGHRVQHETYVSPWKTRWDYEGARGSDHWSELDTAYAPCNAGREQSPIDIRDAQATDLPELRFAFRNAPLRPVINNGHTIRLNYPPGNGNLLLVGGRRYELAQFHFHYPSEHTVSGTVYGMEAHLMYQTSEGQVAGVTVFIKPGQSNPTMERVWQHMPPTEGQNEVAGVEINPGGLLPRDTRGYYTYTGSLTAPPCTEAVTWFVLKEPAEATPEQIAAFARLYPHDVRPAQPLNGRVVRESR
jgi:carbonic anhydrase